MSDRTGTNPDLSRAATDPALITETLAVVRRWLTEASAIPADQAGERLAGVLRDPKGLDFTVGFVDGVVRPEDRRVAAAALRAVAPDVPAFLPAPLRALVKAGGIVAPVLPAVVVPIAQKALRKMVGHLIIDATDAKLGKAIAELRREGVRLNLNLLGEAVLGRQEAARRLAGTARLLDRADVDYVSIKVSASVGPHNPWGFDEAVDQVVEELTPLFRQAARAAEPKFINLDMEEYKDLDLTIAVFTRILDRPELLQLEAGIVLQAYLPDALAAMIRLQEWSAARRARGGAPIKVRLVKGANLPMEQVEASLHGWPLATWHTKQDTDTNYKRVLDYALRPEHIGNVRLGIAGHNLFDVAYSWLLAGRRGVRDGIEYEMLLGMAQGQAEVVRREVGGLLLYTPVVRPTEFDVAISYLIRRLEEGASTENFMSAVFELDSNAELLAREERRFIASVQGLDAQVPPPHRVADRFAASPAPGPGHFANTPDSDPSVPATREWGRAILKAAATSPLGVAEIASARIEDEATLTSAIDSAAAAGKRWGELPAARRSELLHRAGEVMERRRADFLTVMAAEAGKTLDQADPEVSEAIDFAHYYAELALELEDIDGARFRPSALTLITPPWNFPVAIPAGGTLAALATGSAALLKPAALTERCGALIAECLWEAGIPRDALRLIQIDEGALGQKLIAHPLVDRVILTGAYETAQLFRSFRADLPLLAETSGKNALIITPSADIDLAVKDLVHSAFGHAGQKCSAASLVVLVGSAARSRRLRTQLVDAVSSVEVGYPTNPATQMGPLVEPAQGKLLDGLTRLEPGQEWLIKPEPLDDSGRLWRPGLRDGVAPGSDYHLTEYFGPILGIMTAETLDAAIDLVNQVDYGLTSGIHSLDPDEIALWLRRIQAGNLYVNRGITGAIVRRQPFGGWKKSAVGAGTKAGGPNYLVGLGDWEATPAAHGEEATDSAVLRLLAAARESLSEAEFTMLERSARSDAAAAAGHFRTADVTGLTAERNLLRYLPYEGPVLVRLGEGGRVADLLRVCLAAELAGVSVEISVADEPGTGRLPESVAGLLCRDLGALHVEDEAAWLRRAAGLDAGRIRLVGGTAAAVCRATGGRPDLAIYAQPVTESGRLELLPFLLEQAVAITAHRFGNPNPLTDALI